MAEIVTSILRIASILCTCNGTNTWCLRNLQENMVALVTVMEELKDTRDDVMRKIDEAESNPYEPMKRNQEVVEWLQRVQTIDGEVVKVIQKADQENRGICFGGYCSINCWSANKTGRRVIQTLTIVKDFRCQGFSFVDVAYKLPPPLSEGEAMNSTVGMDFMFQKVWRLLAEDEVRIMGLYGQGGVGKTTLLKQINNEFLKSTTTTTSHGFDVVILVEVSEKINIDVIQKEIGRRLGLSSPNRTSIFNALSDKNFLLLLDDIWERVDLHMIGVPPPENNKSKVIFTTRFETVCGAMEADKKIRVECLPWDKAWSLFQEKVGEKALNSHPKVAELAEVVAKECGGLPLALVTIGRVMATKKTLQEWNHAITTLRSSASEFPGMGDRVLPLLKLTYDNLGDDMIKSCFLYCALFPEDHSIDKANLVDRWIGEGLISLNEFNHIDEARNYGYYVIGILKSACLLESGEDEETQVKMHNMIRDLALWINHDCGGKRDKILTIESIKDVVNAKRMKQNKVLKSLERMKQKVLKSIDEDEVKIMGLYGRGGVGKTTLLKQINKEFLKSITTTTHGFNVVILVVVSKALNIDAIQREIGDRLGLSSPNKTSIFNVLSKKNFLLLLDDIWEMIDLQSIGVPHPENKSKVIFTTRSETVCCIMDANKTFKVECLPWDEAWTLFQEKVGGNETLYSYPDVPDLAKVVARKCGGLPLALITIGRAMSTKKTVQEWKHAITTLRRAASDFPGMGDEALPLLKLSYDSLRNDTIKSCFLYCALYPEDWSIDKANLVDRWIGEELISLNEFDHIDEARNYGYDVIGILKSACLLESGEDEETQVKMHDTFRDLALWINHECGGSKREFSLILDTHNLMPSERLLYTAGRIHLRFTYKGECAEVVPLKSPNLLTLICELGIPEMLPIPDNFFEFMPLLQVLDLSKCEMKTFPASITELLELQRLSLQASHIQELPLELRKLVKLKNLDLSYMKFLKKIPDGVIGSLLELQVLNLYKCSGADYTDIEELYNLKHLNDLRISIKTDHNLNKLLSNQNLQMCTRNLQLSPWHPFSSPSLESLSNLESLTLAYLCELADMGSRVQDQQYIVGSCFQNLGRIYIHSCNALKDLTWVGYVGNLNSLDVYFCDELEEIIISTDIIVVDDVFRRLKTLKMMGLPKLKSICRDALVFPCLETMEFFECPQLMKLPFDSGSNVNNTLQKIEGEEEWWNELQWEDDVKSKFLHLFGVFCG